MEDATSVFRKRADGSRARVVLVRWPRPDVQSVGILVRHIEDGTEGGRKAVVYLPNSPNPLAGMLRIVDLDQLAPTDWNLNDALAFTISRGATSPSGGPGHAGRTGSPEPRAGTDAGACTLDRPRG